MKQIIDILKNNNYEEILKKHWEWLKENKGKKGIVIKDVNPLDFYGLK
jgi:hypothetical protein